LFVCLFVTQVPVPETPRLVNLEKRPKPLPSPATLDKVGDARFVEPLPKTPLLAVKTPVLGAKERPVKTAVTTPRVPVPVPAPAPLPSPSFPEKAISIEGEDVEAGRIAEGGGGGGGGESMNAVVNLLKSISEKIDQIPPAASPAMSWMSPSRANVKTGRGEGGGGSGSGSGSVRATPLKKRGTFLFCFLFCFVLFVRGDYL